MQAVGGASGGFRMKRGGGCSYGADDLARVVDDGDRLSDGHDGSGPFRLSWSGCV